MSKTYLIPGDELTPEERENIRTFSEKQEQDLRDQQARSIELDKTRSMVTLEQLLKTRIAPEEDRIVVWKDKVSSVTEGGLLKAAETVQKEEREVSMGTVLAVGPGKKSQTSLTNRLLWAILKESENGGDEHKRFTNEVDGFDQITLNPGDHIIFGKFAGVPVPDPDTKEEVLIMRPADIFGKIRPV